MITFPMEWLAFAFPATLLVVSVVGWLVERLARRVADLWAQISR